MVKKTFTAPYDKVWAATVQAFNTEEYQLSIVDKTSGVIQANMKLYTLADADKQLQQVAWRDSIFMAVWNMYRYKVSAELTDLDDGTVQVKIRAVVDGYNNMIGWTICYTKGVLENRLMKHISSKLDPTDPSVKTAI